MIAKWLENGGRLSQNSTCRANGPLGAGEAPAAVHSCNRAAIKHGVVDVECGGAGYFLSFVKAHS